MMPDLTGMDVFEEVERRWPDLADRFVFISGGGVNERSRQFIERQAARLVTKPIDSHQLSKLLAEGARTLDDGAEAHQTSVGGSR
jgi:YesN/AraC family two-component response regulator